MTDDLQKPLAPPPVIFAVAFLAGLGIDVVRPMPTMPLVPQIIVGLIMVSAGVFLIRSSMMSFARAGTTYDPYAASAALVTTGIYQYTRNPGYLGLAFIQFGLAVMIDSPWIALTGAVAVFLTDRYVIVREERKLYNAFGDAYRDYFSQARRWL